MLANNYLFLRGAENEEKEVLYWAVYPKERNWINKQIYNIINVVFIVSCVRNSLSDAWANKMFRLF